METAGDSLILENPVDVSLLPGFSDGYVSVQDSAAQLAAGLLDLKPGQTVLDACAAPGGKATHILQQCPSIGELVAVDIDADRTTRIKQDLNRLGCQAKIVVGDVSKPETWWQGIPFDRILLDVPCTATGVIRRHPDIKILRSSADVESLCELQQRLLTVVWSMLAVGGVMLYSTCSILKQENCGQISRFLIDNTQAKHLPISADWGIEQTFGRQIITGIVIWMVFIMRN